MYRIRFENVNQIFEGLEGEEIVLPLKEAYNHPELKDKYKLIVEIPSIIWEHSIPKTKEMLSMFSHAICENIGAISLCKELGITMHGGMYLNIVNGKACEEYKKLGLSDITWSFELPFNKMRSIRPSLPAGAVTYGYLPLMKFRNCPAQGEQGCKGCTKDKVLKDRKGEEFRIICRNSEYSELLNCVPLYVEDKILPPLSFETLYFTVETKDECRKIYKHVLNKDEVDFRKTAGLYYRDLL